VTVASRERHRAGTGPGRRVARRWPGSLGAAAIAILVLATGTLRAAEPATDPLPAPTHRPLRANRPFAPPNPVPPRRFEGYAGAASFRVLPQKPGILLFPCTQCHAAKPPDPTPRALVGAPHVADLPHGNGRMWCIACHKLDDRDLLVLLDGTPVDFDDAHLVCGQCHGNRHRDWWFGAHGKRAANWSGERVIWNCTHCHDPHQPALAPRKPSKPPPLRARLSPMPAHEAAAAADAAPAGRSP
jgi:hypothetical protein